MQIQKGCNFRTAYLTWVGEEKGMKIPLTVIRQARDILSYRESKRLDFELSKHVTKEVDEMITELLKKVG